MPLIEQRSVTHIRANERGAHSHTEGQLFLVQQGVVTVEIEGARWVMPPGCIGWVPPRIEHGAQVHGPMEGFSLYFQEEWSLSQMPGEPRIVRLTPLLTALIDAMRAKPKLALEHLTQYLAVFAHAFSAEPMQTLFLPMPRDLRLLRMSTAMLEQPDDATDLDGWAQRIGMAKRTLTRHFQAETGLSFVQWRQQMRLLIALERLARGTPVTTVALDLGYSSVSSFIAVFHRYLGATPRAYFTQN